MQRIIVLATVGLVGFALFGQLDALSAAETIKYKYDARGRLIAVERSGTINNNVKSTYSYDRANNRINVTTTGK